MAEEINLGDKITLSGFSDEEGSTMVVVKKMVGNYVKKIMDDKEDVQRVSVVLKKVHAHPDGKGGKSEVHVKIDAGQINACEVTDFNLFIALDKAFKKAIASMS